MSLPFVPPPPGEAQFSLYRFPLPGPLSVSTADIATWFDRFAECRSPADVKKILVMEWQAIVHPSLKHFAAGMAAMEPIGVLHSKHRDGIRNAWLVLSATAADLGTEAAICRGVWLPRTLYLTPPHDESIIKSVDAHDLVRGFFVRFGGLRYSPPFQAGNWYDVPTRPVEWDAGELDKLSGSRWENARAVYVSDTGDELLLNSAGDVGWLLFDTREIRPLERAFDDMLIESLANFGLSPRTG